MATKIVLCSDNHGDIDAVRKILNDNPNADYYFHCGDFCDDPTLVSPFVIVKGNNDWDYDLDKQRIFEIGNHRILMIHGNGYTFSIKDLTNKTIDEGCDTVFFGHTHEFYDEMHNGIRMVNPGSCLYNRDYSSPCYARVTIDENDEIIVEKVDLADY